MALLPETAVAEGDCRLYCQSAEVMAQLADGSVALTVTSPPYWNAIDYDIHARHQRQRDYRQRRYGCGFEAEGDAGYQGWLDWAARVFSEVFRATKPGGFCAVVIGTILQDGVHYPAPFDLLGRLQQAGWLFHQDIIWNKVTAGVRRAGVAIQQPYPGYYYPNIMTEYILLLRKPGEAIFRQRNGGREASRYQIDDLFKRDIANNIWHIAPVPPGIIDHPCPFPEEIPARLIRLYSWHGEMVLDPFLGSGQTAKVALQLGRRAVGYDIIQRYIDTAAKRLQEPSRIRNLQLVPRMEKIACSPVDGLHGPKMNAELPEK